MTAPCAGMVPPPCAIPPAKAKHSASQVTHPNRTKNGRCPGLACGRGGVCRDGSGRHVHVHGQLYRMPGLQLRVVGCLQLPVRVRVCPPFVRGLQPRTRPPLVPVGAGWVRGSTALACSEETAIQTATVSQALWLHAWACSADCVRAADTLSTASLAAAAKRPRTSPRIPRASHTLCFFSSPSSRPGYSETR